MCLMYLSRITEYLISSDELPIILKEREECMLMMIYIASIAIIWIIIGYLVGSRLGRFMKEDSF